MDEMNTEIRRVRCEALGTIVELPERPRRIVSLVAGYTEGLWEMGLAERVVGVSKFCGRYVDIGGRPVVGDYLKIDDAAVAGLEPDLVVMTGGIQLGVARRLAAAGLPVYVLPLADSFAGIVENGRRLGALAGEMRAAHALTARMEREAAELRASAPAVRPRVYVELWFGRHPRMTGGLTFVHDLVEMAGGENVWADAPTGYLKLDLAGVVEKEPDVVVIFWEDDDTVVDAVGLMQARGWAARLVEAQLRPGQILIHDGPSCLRVARWLRGRLLPGLTVPPVD
jgi:ABC-type Fe3+-hydroxamate transport system substrate-binding protein